MSLTQVYPMNDLIVMPGDPPDRHLAPVLPDDQHRVRIAVDAYLASLKSERSQRVMRDDLAMIAALVLHPQDDPKSIPAAERRDLIYVVPWHKLGITEMEAIQAALARRYKHHTANRMMCAVRGVLRSCRKRKLLSPDDYQDAVDFKPITGETLLRGRNMDAGEIAALFRACASDPTPAGARDAALFACMFANLRRAEIAALDLADYNTETGELIVRHGKGNKAREVPLGDARRALDDWLKIRGNEPGALLWPVNKGGKLSNRRLSPQATYNASQKRAKEAGVEHFSPHDFRRTYAGDLLDLNVDLSTVQKLMGHADPATTARYDRRPKETRRKAVGLRHMPYTERKQQALPEK